MSDRCHAVLSCFSDRPSGGDDGLEQLIFVRLRAISTLQGLTQILETLGQSERRLEDGVLHRTDKSNGVETVNLR